MKPQEIESLSFKIIEEEAGTHSFDPGQWQIVRRVIHTTADFEYLQNIRIHPQAIERGVAAIRQGKIIITDTNMARVGIRKTELSRFGGKAECLIRDPEVCRIASEQGITRAKAAAEAAWTDMNDGIFVVGNTPTALLHLIELATSMNTYPAPHKSTSVGL